MKIFGVLTQAFAWNGTDKSLILVVRESVGSRNEDYNYGQLLKGVFPIKRNGKVAGRKHGPKRDYFHMVTIARLHAGEDKLIIQKRKPL